MAEKFANNYVAHIQNSLAVDETQIFVDIQAPAVLQVALSQPGDVITDTWMAKIGDELVRVIDYDSNALTLTVQRAQEGTVAAEHDAGAVIGHVLTAASLDASIVASIGTVSAANVTFENLDANGDVGSGAAQVPAGDHTHAAPDSTVVTTAPMVYSKKNIVWDNNIISPFGGPQGVTTSPDGRYLYVMDCTVPEVLKLDTHNNNAFVLRWGSDGTGDGQFATPNSTTPSGIATDSSGNVFVADYGNDRIQKFDSSGTYLSQFGTTGAGNGQFDSPRWIAIDSSNNIYVTEVGNLRVQKFNSAGTYITQWGSFGSGNSQFNDIEGIAINDNLGRVYVCDGNNFRIQYFDLTGTYLGQWGNSSNFPPTNGFDYVFNVAVDDNDYVYTIDQNTGKVYIFDANGGYISQFGNYSTYGALAGVTINGNDLYLAEDSPNQVVYPMGIAGGIDLQGALNDTLSAGVNEPAGSYTDTYLVNWTPYILGTYTNASLFFVSVESTVTIPTAVGKLGKTYTIKNISAAATVSLATTGVETIDGSAPGTLAATESITLISDGANWQSI